MNMNDMMRAAMMGNGDYALDAVKSEPKEDKQEETKPAAEESVKPNSKMSGAETFYTKKTALEACNMLNHWAASDDELDDGESQSDRLYALMVGVVDQDKNGTMNDAEQEVFDLACEAVSGYLTEALGADEEDVSALMNDWDDDAAERVREFMQDGFDGDELISLAHDFALSDDSGETLDAAYKSFIVVRDGKKAVARKRISGKITLSTAQKSSILKAQRLSHSTTATVARMLSMKKRKKLGIKPRQVG